MDGWKRLLPVLSAFLLLKHDFPGLFPDSLIEYPPQCRHDRMWHSRVHYSRGV